MSEHSLHRFREELPAYLNTVIGLDRGDFPGLYTKYFNGSPAYPRPLTRLYNEALSQRSARLRPEHYWQLDQALRIDAVFGGGAIDVTSTRRQDAPDGTPTDACPDAEPNFDLAYRQLLDDETCIDAGHRIISVYHDVDGKPIFVRKSHKASSALSLVAMRDICSNVTMPPGSIFGVDNHKPEVVTGVTDYPTNHLTTDLRSIQFDPESTAVLPLRLSPWAFREPINRAVFSVEQYGRRFFVNDKRLEVIGRRTLDDFTALGHEIMRICNTVGSDVSA